MAPNSYTAKIEEALWLLHSYESNRDDGGRVYSELDIAEMVAALRGSDGPNVPEGWKIVPLEPTEGMVNAFWREYADDVKASTVIRAVIEAVVELPPHATSSGGSNG